MEENKVEIQKVNDREYRVEQDRVFMNGENILCFVSIGECDEKKALAVQDAVRKLLGPREGKTDMLIDLNNAGKQTSGARRVWSEANNDPKVGKNALFGLHPVARVLASFVMGISRKKDLRFFKTREEALEWLREE